MLQMANKAQVGGFVFPKAMTLVPIFVFADELLIMSMAAIGLQQQLHAKQCHQIVKEKNLHKRVHELGLQEKQWDLTFIEKISQRQLACSNQRFVLKSMCAKSSAV